MQNENEKLEVTIDIYRFLSGYNQRDFYQEAIKKSLIGNPNFNKVIADIVQKDFLKSESIDKISTNVHVAVDKYFSQTKLADDYNFKNEVGRLIREAVKEQQGKINEMVSDVLKEINFKDQIEKQIQVEISQRVNDVFGRYGDYE